MSFSNPASEISRFVTRAIARRKGGAEPSADAAAAYQSAITRYNAAFDILTVANVRVSAGRPSAADRKAYEAAGVEYKAASRAWTPAYAAWCLHLVAAAPAKTAKTLTDITDYEDQVQGSLRAPLVSPDAGGVDCRKLLAAMNDRIAALLDREHRIGHTYFLRVDSVEALAETFRTRIVPLLQEYFYDDWEKIRAVLNWNGFVRESKPPDELVRSNLVDAEQRAYELPPADDDRWTDPKQYRKIYDVKAQADQAEDGGEAQDD